MPITIVYNRYKARHEKGKVIFPEEDFIESGVVKQVKALSREDCLARVVVVEDANFSRRIEQEQQALLKIKQILEARRDFNQSWVAGLESGGLIADDYARIFIRPKYAHQIKALSLSKIVSFFAEDRDTYQELIDRFKLSDERYFLEKMYIYCDFQYLFMQSDGTSITKNEYAENSYLKQCLELLSPLLTEEFLMFYKQANFASNARREQTIVSEKLFLQNLIMLNSRFLDLTNDKFMKLQKYQIKFVRKHLRFVEQNKLGETIITLGTRIDAAISTWLECKNDFYRKNDLYATQKQSPANDELLLGPDRLVPFIGYAAVRDVYSIIYNIAREIEELQKWYENFSLRINLSPKVRKHPTPEKAEIYQFPEVPSLDECVETSGAAQDFVTTEKTLTQDEVDDFLLAKSQQLAMWRATIEERRTQKEQELKTLSAQFSSLSPVTSADEMDEPTAKVIISISSTLEAEHNAILQSLFVSGPRELRAHQLSFNDIKKLIVKCRGSITKLHGSHFGIELPNTYKVVNFYDTSLSYHEIPELEREITGGSYIPHGRGERWCLDAHKLCAAAFAKAGITPARIEIANALLKRKQRSMPSV